jgi:dipeptide transport system substrate-binding protein
MGMPKLLKSVTKVDDYTVKVVLNHPEAPFLDNLAMEYAGIQSKEYADAMLKAGTPEKIDQEPIGTGPFYLVQYQKDAVIRYKAFPQFWGGKAKIDDLVFSITPDASVRWAKLQKGECHVMPYPNPADMEAIRKDPNIQVLEQPGLNVGYLAYNTTKKPFDDVRVRKAINMAINKTAIINGVYLGTGIAAKNPIPPSMWSYNDAIKDDPYDPAAAKKLLAQAGYPEGKGLAPITMRFPTTDASTHNEFDLFKSQLAAIGVQLVGDFDDAPAFAKALDAGNYQLASYAYYPDYPDAEDFYQMLYSKNVAPGPNFGAFSDAAYDKAYEASRHMANGPQRFALFKALDAIIRDEVPLIPVREPLRVDTVQNWVGNYKRNVFTTEMQFLSVDMAAKRKGP